MKTLTYFLVLAFAVVFCLVASFDKRIRFYKHFKAFVKAAVIVAIPFIAWDIWFTKTNVWWFDSSYTIGVSIFGLPIEECLFFICIPFSCVFTYFCFDTFFNLKWADAFGTIIVFVSTIVCCVVALLHYDKAYTFVTASAAVLVLIYLHFIARVSWIGRASFLFFVLMLGFFPVNAVLTGTGLESPIVNYNPNEFLGIRMLTIPIEDAVYGYAQFLLVLYVFKLFTPKTHENKP